MPNEATRKTLKSPKSKTPTLRHIDRTFTSSGLSALTIADFWRSRFAPVGGCRQNIRGLGCIGRQGVGVYGSKGSFGCVRVSTSRSEGKQLDLCMPA